MSKLLIKTNYNWADEADFPSFCIMTEFQFEEAKTYVKAFFDNPEYAGIEVSVGTNEEIAFDRYEDVFGSIRPIQLTEAEANTIEKLLGERFGECTLEDVVENIGYIIEDN